MNENIAKSFRQVTVMTNSVGLFGYRHAHYYAVGLHCASMSTVDWLMSCR